MIQLENFAIRRGGNLLFAEASMQLHPGWKIGLTGVNGAGKSSLFAAFMGTLQGDSGSLSRPASWTVAHMAQEVENQDTTALDFVLSGDDEWWKINQQLEHESETMSLELLGELHGRFGEIDGYTAPARASQMLAGLGFTESKQGHTVSSFSGGWRMRLNLARTLMSRSDLLLLDEPTNHLDLDAILWLEDWLKAYQGTLVLISHDRDFLDAVVDRIIHLEGGKATLYTGNYSTFEKTRAERLAQQQQSFEKQQVTKAHLQKYIDRFKAQASKAKQAQSRIKQLERMQDLSPAHVESSFTFSFYPPTKTSSPLLTLEHATVGYVVDKPIVNDIRLQLTPDSRIGLLGLNGAGKSTLIKGLVGDLTLQSGERIASEHLNLGYFAQHQLDALDGTASPMLAMKRLAGHKIHEGTLRAFLGSFGFSGERMDTPCLNFSGGERARLALALIVWQRPNVLILDEPTNHLDLEMRLALTMALQSYEGAVVLVSHERQLIAAVCEELLLVHDGRSEVFEGDLKDYADWLRQARADMAQKEKIERQALAEQAKLAKANPVPVAKVEVKAEVKTDAKADTKPDAKTVDSSQSLLSKEELRKIAADKRTALRPLKVNIETTEKSIQKTQTRLVAIETALADPTIYDAENKAKLLKLIDEQTALKAQLSVDDEALLEMLMTLESLESDD